MTVGERERQEGRELKRGRKGGKEARQRRRGSTSWNEMLCNKAVRATHLFI